MPNIFYLSPYDHNEPNPINNIGGVYNEQISCLPDDAWICLLDHDAMFLRSDSKRQIHEIISRNEFDVYGCVTNRLASTYQLYNGEFSEETDIMKHMDIAKYLHVNYYGKVIPSTEILAGFCLCFSKKTWEQIKFKERSIQLDSEFCNDARSKGFKLGLMLGVYMFHLYRMGSRNPKFDIGHLWRG